MAARSALNMFSECEGRDIKKAAETSRSLVEVFVEVVEVFMEVFYFPSNLSTFF